MTPLVLFFANEFESFNGGRHLEAERGQPLTVFFTKDTSIAVYPHEKHSEDTCYLLLGNNRLWIYATAQNLSWMISEYLTKQRMNG